MRVLLLGVNSQLGHDLLPALAGHSIVTTGRQDLPGAPNHHVLDLADTAALHALVLAERPQVIINTTAFHRVDDIEHDVSEALRMNGHVPHQLALVSRETNAVLVHVSTDYVFDGAKRAPYVESDPVAPLSAYASSKVAGEWLVRNTGCMHLIVRSCGLYGLAGSAGKGGNFVNTMLRLAKEGKPIRVVDDQVCTPTFTQDLARQMVTLIEHALQRGAWGTYHVTQSDDCTWHEFATEIFRLAGLTVDLAPTSSAAFRQPATRPPYSVLENAGLQLLGIDGMRPWQTALADYLRQKGVTITV